jgi:outer membrane protein assembly complex protein YaeT
VSVQVLGPPASRRRAALHGLVLALAASFAAGCLEDREGLRVTNIEFRGVEAVSESELKELLATRESGRMPWSRPRYFDRAAFLTDLERVRRFYQGNGYPDARVVQFDARPRGDEALELVITIDEGEPIIVEDVRLDGFDVVPEDHRQRLRETLPLRAGEVQRAADVAGARSQALRELQDHGFARADVVTRDEPGSRVGRRVWIVEAKPGPKSYFGPIEINGNEAVNDDVVRRELSFHPGETFSLGAIQESQRRLYGLELFRYANIEPLLREDGAAEVPVRITVSEGKPRQLSGSIGYGTEEDARAEGGWRHRNFLGGARVAGVEGKWSSLDRGVRANFTQPFFLGVRQSLSINGQNWYYNEPVYRLATNGGRIALNRERSRRDPVLGRGVTTLVSGALVYEFQSYRISNEALADLSLRDELIALGLDPRTGRRDGTLAALALDLRRDTTDSLLNATHGYVVSAHAEQAGWWLPGSYDYFEISGEVRHFLPIGSRTVLATRGRLGSIDGRGTVEHVPFFKRYFLGGATSLRGWGRYEVAPLSASGLPLGGHSFVELSAEARVAAFGKVGFVAFVDAGNVWSGSWNVDLGDLRVAAGPGLRYDTPLGPVRFDVGVQLTPIDNLLVDGKPERRQWRMHFSIGHAF